MSQERLLRSEIIQRREEGYDVRDVERRLLSILDDGLDAVNGKLESIWSELESLKVESGFKFHEPSDLKSIKQARPSGKRDLGYSESDEAYYNQVFVTFGNLFKYQPTLFYQNSYVQWRIDKQI